MLKYTLIRKPIKKMYLRVKDNEVIVTAPRYTTKRQIDEFVIDHMDWIEKHYKTIHTLKDHDKIRILEDEYTIIFTNDRKPRIESNIIYTPKNEKIFKKFLLNYTKAYFYDRFYELMEECGYSDIELKLRYYKSKWGSCTPSKHLICLNVNLVYSSFDCIDAIIYHELAHLKVLNHSKAFYDVLLAWFPEYRKVVKKLKNIDIPQWEND